MRVRVPTDVSLSPGDAERRLLTKVYAPPHRWGSAKMTHRRSQNHVQAQLEHATGAVRLRSLPIKLTIESTNICNLRCVACPTGVDRLGRPRGHFSVQLFEWLMRELGATLFEVELHNWGEPLLGKNVGALIRMATEAGVSTTVSTNFSIPFDDARARELVAAGLAVLGVSIDGATQGTYEKYRVRGDLALVLENCRRVALAKQRLGVSDPKMFWSYRVFQHNAHEVDLARRMAEDLGMVFVATRGWTVGEASDVVGEFPYPWGEGFPDRCHFLWFQAVVHHDGGVAPCCGTFWAEDDFRRLSADPALLDAEHFADVWNGPSFTAARALFHERTGGPDVRRLACFDCPETVDFEGWKAHLRGERPDFERTSSNVAYNYFFSRGPDEGPRLVQLSRR